MAYKHQHNLKRCTCGCEEFFPATPEFFQPNVQCVDGFVGVCRKCRTMKEKRTRASREYKFKVDISNQYDDFIFC